MDSVILGENQVNSGIKRYRYHGMPVIRSGGIRIRVASDSVMYVLEPPHFQERLERTFLVTYARHTG